jgi:hypothetical protein
LRQGGENGSNGAQSIQFGADRSCLKHIKTAENATKIPRQQPKSGFRKPGWLA